jgi:hypothetical protein
MMGTSADAEAALGLLRWLGWQATGRPLTAQELVEALTALSRVEEALRGTLSPVLSTNGAVPGEPGGVSPGSAAGADLPEGRQAAEAPSLRWRPWGR